MAGHKWWRVSNIKNNHYLNTGGIASFSQSIAVLHFIGGGIVHNTSDLTKAFSKTQYSDNYKAKNAFDNNKNTIAHNRNSNIDDMEDWHIGYEFNTPVSVSHIGLQARQDMSPKWEQEWQIATIEYSDDGVDWVSYGYIEPKIQHMDLTYHICAIQQFDMTKAHRYWRIWQVLTTYTNGLYVNGAHFAKIRFNTITGGVSNNPNNAYHTSTYNNDEVWQAKNSFDAVIPYAGQWRGNQQRRGGDPTYYVRYDFNKPEIVTSLTVLDIRGNDGRIINTISAIVQYSDDDTTWVHAGYAHLYITRKDRFYTSDFNTLTIFELPQVNQQTQSTHPNITTTNEQGKITVPVTELGLPEAAEVCLYDRRTRQPVQIKRSDANGNLVFTGIDKHREYYLHAIHDERKFNAVTQDMIPGNYDELKAKGLL